MLRWPCALIALGLCACGSDFAEELPPLPACGADELQDDFSAPSLSALWRLSTNGDAVGAGVEAGRAFVSVLPHPTAEQAARFTSQNRYDFRDCAIWVAVPRPLDEGQDPQGEFDATTFLMLHDDADNGVDFELGGGWLDAVLEVGGPHVAEEQILYRPSEHRWWRLSERAGTIRYETSPEGTSWTTHMEQPTPPELGPMEVIFGGRTSDPWPVALRAEFDDVNRAP